MGQELYSKRANVSNTLVSWSGIKIKAVNKVTVAQGNNLAMRISGDGRFCDVVEENTANPDTITINVIATSDQIQGLSLAFRAKLTLPLLIMTKNASGKWEEMVGYSYALLSKDPTRGIDISDGANNIDLTFSCAGPMQNVDYGNIPIWS